MKLIPLDERCEPIVQSGPMEIDYARGRANSRSLMLEICRYNSGEFSILLWGDETEPQGLGSIDFHPQNTPSKSKKCVRCPRNVAKW